MPSFGTTSSRRLQGVNHKLQDLMLRVVLTYDCSIVYGLRTEEEQRNLVAKGLSKTMNSKHLTGDAVDVAPYPIDWDNTKRFYHFAGFVQAVALEMGIKIRWGGDWDMDYDLDDQTFMDLIHFELI